jgi:hypothetical protein
MKRANKIPTFEQFISEEELRIAGDDDDDLDFDFLYEPRAASVCAFISRNMRDTFGDPPRRRRERLVEVEIEVIPEVAFEIVDADAVPPSLRAA